MLGFCCCELNPFGPLQLYDTPPLALRFRLEPVHTGLLLDALAIGGVPIATLVDAIDKQPLALVTVTEYIPPAEEVAVKVGFCCSELNPLGPLQAYEAPALANRFRVFPVQTGLLLAAVAWATALMVTAVVVEAEQPAALVTVNV